MSDRVRHIQSNSWKVEYIDKAGMAKITNCNSREEADRLSTQIINAGATWASFSRNEDAGAFRK